MTTPRATPLPVTRVEVELTERCNLRCRFCYNSCAPRESREPEVILDRLAEAGVMEVIFTGGEPALHPRLGELVTKACTLFPRVMIQSNGTLFATPQAFAVLRAQRIFCLNFSLHGPKGVHDALTDTPGAFAATCAALTHAKEAAIRTASNLVLCRANAAPQTLRETVAILADLGCPEMTITRFIPTGLGKGQPLDIRRDEFIQALYTLEDATRQQGLSLLLANAAPACQLPKELHHLCNRCSFGFDKFYIDVNGQVLVCGMSRQALGNILEAPLRDVLDNAGLYARYRALKHIPASCQACEHLEFCGGGCRAAALARTSLIHGADMFPS